MSKILSQTSWRVVNKQIAIDVWVESALLLSDLCDKNEYFSSRWELINIDWDMYFYNTSINIERDTTLSYKVQKKCIKILKDKWYIKTELKWLPAKLHFSICENKIIEKVNASIAQREELDVTKGESNNNKEIIIKNDNKETKQAELETQETPKPKKISSQQEPTHKEEVEYWNLSINSLIAWIKKVIQDNWIIYNDYAERRFAKHMQSLKRKTIYEWFWYKNPLDFAKVVVLASVQEWNWRRWKIDWLMSIYQKYAKVLNEAKRNSIAEQENSVLHIDVL